MVKEELEQLIEAIKTKSPSFDLGDPNDEHSEFNFWFNCLETYSFKIVLKVCSEMLIDFIELDIVEIAERCQLILDVESKLERKESLPPHEFRSYKSRSPILPIHNPTKEEIYISEIARTKVVAQIKNATFKSL